MPEEIMPNLFRIQIPLPESPLRYVNSYVVRSSDRNLIIDTGLNRKACLKAMQDGLRELNLDLGKTDFFITHLHADHFALVCKLVTDTSKTYLNGPDREIVESSERWEVVVSYAGKNGFPEGELRAALRSHPGYKYGLDYVPRLTTVRDGDRFQVGEYLFQCVATPGHSRGHTCLYEASKKLLVSGDHILIDITPNIGCWSNRDNPLINYLASLDRVFELQVDLVLPGHRRLFKNHKQRIEELKRHHQKRADEVLLILQKGPQNAFQVAAQLNWDIEYDTWEQFPLQQKWFATGEAISHLRYLEEKGVVHRTREKPEITYALNHASSC